MWVANVFQNFFNFRKVIWYIYNIKEQFQWGLGQYPVIEPINISALRYMNIHTVINLNMINKNYK